MRAFVAIFLVKCVSMVLKLLGYRGGTLPGRIGLLVYPDILSKIKYPKDVVFITGTNGKTSVNNLICDAFKNASVKVLGNQSGDNIEWGIASTILGQCSFNRTLPFDVLCLEVDELTGVALLPKIKPTMLLVNNFFRDQLDRVGEMNTLISKYEKAIETFTGTLILNANDPNVVRLSLVDTPAQIEFFGMESHSSPEPQEDNKGEGHRCPKCGNVLNYSQRFYYHVGIFECSNHDFKTPTYDVAIQAIDFDHNQVTIANEVYPLLNRLLFSVMNQCAVIAVLDHFKVGKEHISRAFEAFEVEGRMETFTLNKHNETLLNLIKNPAGATELIHYISKQEGPHAILCVLNDNEADGTDVSWIWDAPFEELVSATVDTIICSGTRAKDMALRFKYSGYPVAKIQIDYDIQKGVELLKQYENRSFVLSNYTALQTTRRALKKESYGV